MEPIDTDDVFDDAVIATSGAMSAAVESIQRHADDPRVFLFGESGAGVGWLCRRSHRSTERRLAPLVEVAVQTLERTEHEPKVFDALDRAMGGTLVVRCFDELAPALQRRVLATAGTHRLLATTYANGGKTPAHCLDADVLAAFRAVIEVPPLRARGEDIHALAVHLSKWIADRNGWRSFSLNAGELERLGAHDWPGNVREMANALAARGSALHHDESWDEFAFLRAACLRP